MRVGRVQVAAALIRNSSSQHRRVLEGTAFQVAEHRHRETTEADMTELLSGKNAIISGGGGSIGGGLPGPSPARGAAVFLVGRTREKLDAAATDITSADGSAEVAVVNGLRGSFLTARAAARHITEQRSGVILHLNSASGDGAMPGMGSTGPADAATEAFRRYLAAVVGPHGVRVCGAPPGWPASPWSRHSSHPTERRASPGRWPR
jgi:NAD(P)-dependent dehydrogenase (short-subunit alcohol dehydrogenase family)